MRLALFFALCSMFGWQALAAIPSKTPAAKPAKILAGADVAIGGLAGNGFSLTNVTLAKTPGKERLVIDVGDRHGGVLRGEPGYFHVEMQEEPSRLVIDFAQTANVFLDEKAINQRLKDSKLIAGTSVLVDPTDQTLSLIIDLKKKARAQVFQVPGKKGTGRVVVDLL